MNPVLVKPEGERQSQVVVDGRPDPRLSARAVARARPGALAADRDGASLAARRVRAGRDRGRRQPGRDQPAQHRPRQHARRARGRRRRCSSSPTSTAAAPSPTSTAPGRCSSAAERASIRAFVLNKFRGDPSLLPPAPAELERLTGVPVAGVLPWLEHGLPDEDGAAQRVAADRPASADRGRPLPDRLEPRRVPRRRAGGGRRLRRRRRPSSTARTLVVLPGSKHVAADLAWLERTGLADAVVSRAPRPAAACSGSAAACRCSASGSTTPRASTAAASGSGSCRS